MEATTIASGVLDEEVQPEFAIADMSSKTAPSCFGRRLHLYGMQWSITPKPRRGSSPSDWDWPEAQRALQLAPPISSLQIPEPAATPPNGFTFPQAPVYTLNTGFDARCSRGYFYSADFQSTTASFVKDRLLRTTTPPDVSPYTFDPVTRSWLTKPVPGMVQMLPGLMYVHYIDGDRLKPVTVGAVHTVPSLMASTRNGPRIRDASEHLWELVYGRAPFGSELGTTGLVEMVGLKPNDRSSIPAAGSSDGSYNLASTLVKGKGRGVSGPAVTASWEGAQKTIADVCVTVHGLFRDIMEQSVLKEELEMIDFHATDNNTFGFGGLEPNNTGLQMNVTSDRNGGSMTRSIGEIQGSWHLDQGDDPAAWTFFTVLYNLVDGSDPGVFCLARPGLYAREPGQKVIFMIFKGRDLHSGFAPTEDATSREMHLATLTPEERAYWVSRPTCRVGLVSYANYMATSRMGTMSIAPITGFGNEGGPSPYKNEEITYAGQPLPVLGNLTVARNRLVRESIMQKWNHDQYSGVEGLDPLTELLGSSFLDEQGKRIKCVGPIFHPRVDVEKLDDMRARYRDHANISAQYDTLGMRKVTYKKTQAALLTTAAALPPTERPKLSFVSTATNQQTAIKPVMGRAVSESALSDLTDLDDILGDGDRSAGMGEDEGAMEVDCDKPDEQGVASEDQVGSEEIEKAMEVDREGAGNVEVYTVEEFISHDTRKDGCWYFVKWEGYDVSCNEWVHERDLGAPTDLLRDYLCAVSGVQPKQTAARAHTKPVGSSWDLFAAGTSSRVSKNHRPASLCLAADSVGTPCLKNVMDNIRMGVERQRLDESGHIFVPGSDLQNSGWPDFFEVLTKQHETNDKIASLPSGPWTGLSASLALTQMTHSLALLPRLIKEAAKADVVARAFSWEAVRAYATIYCWYDSAGPSLSEELCAIHASRGLDGLRELHAPFAGVIDHIFRYIAAVYREKAAPGSSVTGHSPTDLRTMPDDMYGWGLVTLRTTKVTLPSIKPNSVPKDIDGQYSRVARLFQDLVSDYVIIPGMRSTDLSYSARGSSMRGKRSDGDAGLKGRLILTGGVISRILCAFDGDDSIMASKEMHDLVLHPAGLFNLNGRRDLTLTAHILSDPEATFLDLDNCLKLSLRDSPSIKQEAASLADLVWKRMVSMGTSKQRSKRPVGFFAPKSPTLGTIPKGRAIIDAPLSADTLLHSGQHSYSTAGLLIREVLAKRRQLPACNPFIRRIMNCLKPSAGSVSGVDLLDSDHFNPVRADNENTKLLRASISGRHLTTSLGISALLAWQCSGLGNMTSAFVNSQNMVWPDLEHCISGFENAQNRSERCSNTKIWGKSPCSWMAIQSANFTVREKFTPMYETNLQKSWAALLGNLSNGDSSTYTGTLCSWSEMVSWILKQQITCLKKANLTVMQFANNASLLGLCLEPTASEMADFLIQLAAQKARDLGGIKGLEVLGFSLSNRQHPEIWIRAAFLAFYDHLDLHLSDTDKKELHFGAMFVEHLLCKISRFHGILARDKLMKEKTLVSMGAVEEQAQGDTWFKGCNTKDYELFPIPLAPDADELNKSLSKVMMLQAGL